MHLQTCFFLVLCLASVIPNIISSKEKTKSDELEKEKEWQNGIYNFTLNDWEGNSTGSYNFSRYEYSTTDEFYNFTFYRNSTRDYNYTVPYSVSTSNPYDWTNYTFTYRPYRTDRPPWRLNFTTHRPITWPHYTSGRPIWPYTTRSPYWPYTTRNPYWPYYTTRRPFRLSIELLAKLNLTLHK